jgi:hypothetical protein
MLTGISSIWFRAARRGLLNAGEVLFTYADHSRIATAERARHRLISILHIVVDVFDDTN